MSFTCRPILIPAIKNKIKKSWEDDSLVNVCTIKFSLRSTSDLYGNTFYAIVVAVGLLTGQAWKLIQPLSIFIIVNYRVIYQVSALVLQNKSNSPSFQQKEKMNVYSWQIPKLQCQFRLTSSHCQTFSVHNKMKQNLNFISKYSSFQREHRGTWPLEQMHIGQYKQKESGSLFLGKTVKLMNTVKVQSPEPSSGLDSSLCQSRSVPRALCLTLSKPGPQSSVPCGKLHIKYLLDCIQQTVRT